LNIWLLVAGVLVEVEVVFQVVAVVQASTLQAVPLFLQPKQSLLGLAVLHCQQVPQQQETTVPTQVLERFLRLLVVVVVVLELERAQRQQMPANLGQAVAVVELTSASLRCPHQAPYRVVLPLLVVPVEQELTGIPIFTPLAVVVVRVAQLLQTPL
jgi:hypothetical protein